MQVLEAAELLVEIVKACGNLDGDAFMLMPPKPQILAEGYKIHVTSESGIDRKTLLVVSRISRRNGV